MMSNSISPRWKHIHIIVELSASLSFDLTSLSISVHIHSETAPSRQHNYPHMNSWMAEGGMLQNWRGQISILGSRKRTTPIGAMTFLHFIQIVQLFLRLCLLCHQEHLHHLCLLCHQQHPCQLCLLCRQWQLFPFSHMCSPRHLSCRLYTTIGVTCDTWHLSWLGACISNRLREVLATTGVFPVSWEFVAICFCECICSRRCAKSGEWGCGVATYNSSTNFTSKSVCPGSATSTVIHLRIEVVIDPCARLCFV